MPTLPLPPLPAGVPIDGGRLPVSSIDDVAAAWARELQASTSAPLRDAIQAGQVGMLLEYQRASRYAAAQSDPGRATDEYLDECLEERGVFRQPDESNGAARARMFAGQQVVSMDAIVAAANAVLAPYTSISCRYAEQSDGWFIGNGASSWSSHVFSRADASGPFSTPNYPDRLYPGTVAAPLATLPNRRPPGAAPNIDTMGRWFLLRVPDVSILDSEVASVWALPASAPSQLAFPASLGGFFCGSGSSLTDQNATFLFEDVSATSDSIYTSLISAVQAIVGEGIRWDLLVDPTLTA